MVLMTAPHKRMTTTGIRDRLFAAWYLYQARQGEQLSQEWLAEAVSKQLGLDTPITQGAVSRWLKGEGPNITTLGALAVVLEVDPGWLAFGAASKAPAPSDPMQEGMRKLLLPEKDD